MPFEHVDLVGLRCASKSTGRLGHIDRVIWKAGRREFLIVIFDDGDTHKGNPAEFRHVRPPAPLTQNDIAFLRNLRIARWNPCDVSL